MIWGEMYGFTYEAIMMRPKKIMKGISMRQNVKAKYKFSTNPQLHFTATLYYENV